MKGHRIKASELITFLQEVIQKRGDAPVCMREHANGPLIDELHVVLSSDGDTGKLESISIQSERAEVVQKIIPDDMATWPRYVYGEEMRARQIDEPMLQAVRDSDRWKALWDVNDLAVGNWLVVIGDPNGPLMIRQVPDDEFRRRCVLR